MSYFDAREAVDQSLELPEDPLSIPIDILEIAPSIRNSEEALVLLHASRNIELVRALAESLHLNIFHHRHISAASALAQDEKYTTLSAFLPLLLGGKCSLDRENEEILSEIQKAMEKLKSLISRIDRFVELNEHIAGELEYEDTDSLLAKHKRKL